MSHEVLIHIPDEMFDAIHDFDDDYLADVLRLWDCYKQDWCDCKLILCRFESDDLLIYENTGALCFIRGPVDTEHVDVSFTRAVGVNMADACLTWCRNAAYKELIGRENAGSDLIDLICSQVNT